MGSGLSTMGALLWVCTLLRTRVRALLLSAMRLKPNTILGRIIMALERSLVSRVSRL